MEDGKNQFPKTFFCITSHSKQKKRVSSGMKTLTAALVLRSFT